MPNESVAFIHEDESAGVSLVRLAQSANLSAQLYDSVDTFLADSGSGHLDCVVLDASSSHERALELLRQLRESEGTSTPIILLSKTDQPELRQQAKELGAAGFFREPLDGEALLDAIHWALTDLPDADESSAEGG